MFSVENTEKKGIVFILGLAIVAALLLVNRVFLVFSASDDIAGIEQVFIYYINVVINGGAIYRDYTDVPFLNCQYAPFYFEFLGNALKPVLGNTRADQGALYIILRSVNLLINLLSCVLLAIFAWQMSDRRKYDLWLVGLLTFFCFSNYHFAVRPDSLKSFFLMVTLVAFFYAIFGKKGKPFVLGVFVVSALLAICTKQDAAFIIGALIVTGLFFDSPRRWAKVGAAVSLGVMLLGVFLSLHYGDAFLKNILLLLQFKFSKGYFTHVILGKYGHGLVFISFSLFLHLIISRKFRSRVASMLAMILLIAFPFTIVSSAKWGAAPNYFLDLLMISILLIFFSIKAIPEGQLKKSCYLAFGIMGILMLYKDISSGLITIYSPEDEQRFKANREQVTAIRKKVLSASASEAFYLLTFEKGLCNDLSTSCLFPSYETDRPELLQSTQRYFRGDTTFQMISYPGLSLYPDTAFSTIVSERNVFAVYPKTFRFIEFYDFHESKFTLLDSTDSFYLYKMMHRAGERE